MIDWDVLRTPGFVILAGMAWIATMLGWLYSRKTEGMIAYSIPTLLVVLLVELAAAYYFVQRG